MICSTEYGQSDWESTRRSFQSARSYEEIRGAFDNNGGRRPQRDPPQRRWTATVQHLVCITSGVWDWTADIVMVIDIATPRWWLGSSEDWLAGWSTKLWALSRLQSHIRTLAKLSLVTFWSQSQPVFVTVEFINSLNGRTHVTENIENIYQIVLSVFHRR